MIKKGDNIFIDTNILIFLFSPSSMPNDKQKQKISKYSDILNNVCNNENEVFVSSLVISEFINRYLRLDFNKKKEQSKMRHYKKDYRNNAEGQKAFDIAMRQLEKFYTLTSAKHISDGFESVEFSAFSKKSNLDFNDVVIAEIVKTNGLRILTDDNDFKAMGVDIVKVP